MKEANKKKSTDKKTDTPESSTRSPLSSPNTDPEGSYTGVCENKNEIPTQDADDL